MSAITIGTNKCNSLLLNIIVFIILYKLNIKLFYNFFIVLTLILKK